MVGLTVKATLVNFCGNTIASTDLLAVWSSFEKIQKWEAHRVSCCSTTNLVVCFFFFYEEYNEREDSMQQSSQVCCSAWDGTCLGILKIFLLFCCKSKRLMCPVIACHCVLMQIHSHLKNRHEWLLVGCIPPPRLTIPLLYLLIDASHLNTPDYFLRN